MKTVLTLSAVAVLVAGCSSGSSHQVPVPVVTPPPVASKVTFSAFVAEAFGQDADAEPLEVNDDQLLFDVDNDPAAFDALISVTE